MWVNVIAVKFKCRQIVTLYCNQFFILDSLLTETITNNPLILEDLGKCLDTEYQYGKVPCWRDLAKLLGVPPEAYEHCGTFSATSPTEDLFVFLTATKPQLTIDDVKEALKEIGRCDVAHYLDRKIAGFSINSVNLFLRNAKSNWHRKYLEVEGQNGVLILSLA